MNLKPGVDRQQCHRRRHRHRSEPEVKEEQLLRTLKSTKIVCCHILFGETFLHCLILMKLFKHQGPML